MKLGWFGVFLFLLLLSGCGGTSGGAVPTMASVAAVPTLRATPTPAGNPPLPTSTLPAAAGRRTIGDPYSPELGNDGYFVQHYTIRLSLDPAIRFVKGVTTIEAISQMEGLRQLALDFVGYEVTAITVDGEPVAAAREGAKLVVALPAGLPAGTPFEISIGYEGEPPRHPSAYVGFFDHLGLIYPGDGTIFAFNQPDGARMWFPANDHPRDKATFAFEITVPQGLTAVANGIQVDRRRQPMPDGRPGETFVWRHDYPMATYLATVAVGDYVRIDGGTVNGVQIRHYVLPELEAEFRPLAAVVEEALPWMEERLGPYPFEAFGYVTVRGPRLSLETQTMVLLSDRTLNENIVVHELSHAWLGNWVSIDSWADLWRNEGFATYLAALWETRANPAGLPSYMEGVRTHARANTTGQPLNALPPEYMFSADAYFSGALLVYNLHGTLGDERFWSGLRAYLAHYGGGTASQAEFQAVLEREVGYSLVPLFEQWLSGY